MFTAASKFSPGKGLQKAGRQAEQEQGKRGGEGGRKEEGARGAQKWRDKRQHFGVHSRARARSWSVLSHALPPPSPCTRNQAMNKSTNLFPSLSRVLVPLIPVVPGHPHLPEASGATCHLAHHHFQLQTPTRCPANHGTHIARPSLSLPSYRGAVVAAVPGDLLVLKTCFLEPLKALRLQVTSACGH